MGYYGPVDLSSYQHEPVVMNTHNQRIEPTLATDGERESLYINETIAEQTAGSDFQRAAPVSGNNPVDIGELVRLKFLSNRKLQLGVIAGVALIFIAVFATSLFNSISQQKNTAAVELSEPQQVNKKASNIISSKEHLLAMPDDFNLYLSLHRGIIIHWQADEIANGELWSLLTADGDKSCQNIKFNKGAPLRALTVMVENGNEYFAIFSPLDSKELVQAIAFRGKFSLCDYSFSLKGSQTVLGKNSQYAPFLDKDA